MANSTLFSFEHSSPGSSNYKQALVADLLAVLTEKLQSFWRLAQSYSNTEDERYREKQDDIDVRIVFAMCCTRLFHFSIIPANGSQHN